MKSQASKFPTHRLVAIIVLVLMFLILLTGFIFSPPDLTKTEDGRALLKARQIGTSQALREVMTKHPNTYAAKLAYKELPKAMLNEAERYSKPDLYRDLIKEFPESDSAKEARDKLPKLILRQARSSQSVMAYHSLLNEFPNIAEAASIKDEIHKTYQQAVVNFRSNFPDTPPQQVTFIERLAEYLETSKNPVVEVRFVEYVEYESTQPFNFEREYVIKELQRLFVNFRSGSLELKEGSPLKDIKETGEITRPTINVKYKSNFNGTFYSGKNGESASGETVTLKLILRIPNDPTVIELASTGRTPSRFTIYGTENGYTKASELAKEAAFENLYKQWIPADKSE